MSDDGPRVELRDLRDEDLDTLFAQQQDHEANHMAAFVNRDPADRAALDAHWSKIRTDGTVTIQAVLCDGALEVSYWLGREKGFARYRGEDVEEFVMKLEGETT